MPYDYGRKVSRNAQLRLDRWRFWILVVLGSAITLAAVVLGFLK